MKIVLIASENLEYLQAALVGQQLRRRHEVILIYPGRSHEVHVARNFIEHLNLPEPDVKLDGASNDREVSLGALLTRLEHTLADRQPDLVVLIGATDAAVAGALAAARLRIPIAHVEAGRRSLVKHAPGEVNRLLIDRVADELFCSTQLAVEHLAAEGIVQGVHLSGDVLLDAVQRFLPVARQRSSILSRVGLHPGVYLLAMVEQIERRGGTGQLRGFVSAFNAIREPIVLPSYADTRSAVELRGLTLAPHVLPVELVGYVDRLVLASNARVILTDSQDVQREAYVLGVPCITLVDTTELPETVGTGWNFLAGTQPDRIIAAVRDFIPPADRPPLFGDGHAVEYVADMIAAGPIEYGRNYDRSPAVLSPQMVFG